jgi:hypothetical protein
MKDVIAEDGTKSTIEYEYVLVTAGAKKMHTCIKTVGT